MEKSVKSMEAPGPGGASLPDPELYRIGAKSRRPTYVDRSFISLKARFFRLKVQRQLKGALKKALRLDKPVIAGRD